jgi:FtsZ-binding cell division protein ZapB
MPLAPEEKIAKFWEEQQAVFDHAVVLTQQVEELQRENARLRDRCDYYQQGNARLLDRLDCYRDWVVTR